MSALPTTDLVIDVGRAADPTRKAGALLRLDRLSSSGDEPAAFINSTLPLSHVRSTSTAHQFSKVSVSSSKNSGPVDVNSSPHVFKQFEAYLLQTWLEILLPKAGFGAYGNTQTGDVWRSMMAEQIGHQFSKTNTLGIARLMTNAAGKLDVIGSIPKNDPLPFMD